MMPSISGWHLFWIVPGTVLLTLIVIALCGAARNDRED